MGTACLMRWSYIMFSELKQQSKTYPASLASWKQLQNDAVRFGVKATRKVCIFSVTYFITVSARKFHFGIWNTTWISSVKQKKELSCFFLEVGLHPAHKSIPSLLNCRDLEYIKQGNKQKQEFLFKKYVQITKLVFVLHQTEDKKSLFFFFFKTKKEWERDPSWNN